METKNPIINPGEVSSVDIMSALSQRKGVIFLSVFITLFAAVGMSLLTKPTYRATTKVLLRQEKLTFSNSIPAYSTGEQFLKTQEQIIQSKPIISEALKSVALVNRPSKQGNNEALDIGSSQRRISTSFINRTNILMLKVDHQNPILAASLANAIVKAYSNHRNDAKIKLLNDSLRAVSNEIKTAEQHANIAERTLDEYTRKEQMAILPESQIVVDLKRFAGFDAEIIGLGSNIQTLKTRLLDLKEQVRNNHLEELDIPLLLESADIKGFQSKIREEETKLSSLLSEYTIYHPDVINTLNVIERLKQDLKDARQKVVTIAIGSLEMEKKILEEKRDGLFKIAAQYSTRLNKVLFSQPKLAKLLHNVNLRRGIHEGLLGRQRSLTAFKERSKKAQDIIIIEVARVPSRPIKPNILLNSLLGLIVGFGIGIGISLLNPVSMPQEKRTKELEASREYEAGERRRAMMRYSVSAEIMYNILGQPQTKHKGKSSNISGSGIRLIIDQKLKKGDILELEINGTGLDPIFTKGEVIWIGEISELENGEGPFSAGIKFVDMEPVDEKTILKYIEKKNISKRQKRSIQNE